jgi:hypothetical protein
VSRKLLVKCSPYFAAAFGDGNPKTNDGSMEIRDTTIEIFEYFLDWLVHWGPSEEDSASSETTGIECENSRPARLYPENKKCIVNRKDGPFAPDGYHHADRAHFVCVRLHIFASDYDIPQLRIDAMDRLLWTINTRIGNCCDVGDVLYTFRKTPPGSDLRRFLVVCYAWDNMEDLMDLPQEFLAEKLISNMGREEVGDWVEGHMWETIMEHHGHPIDDEEHTAVCPSRIPDLCEDWMAR